MIIFCSCSRFADIIQVIIIKLFWICYYNLHSIYCHNLKNIFSLSHLNSGVFLWMVDCVVSTILCYSLVVYVYAFSLERMLHRQWLLSKSTERWQCVGDVWNLFVCRDHFSLKSITEMVLLSESQMEQILNSSCKTLSMSAETFSTTEVWRRLQVGLLLFSVFLSSS